jgi:cellulose synthase/poly-beta-1,6-N-acetylglucosamine synthase-like glycosyltransferase
MVPEHLGLVIRLTMYRFFEILPGALAWGTFALMVALSRYAPSAVAAFIILFDIYWLLKTIYLSLHLRSTFGMMRENLKLNWRERLEQEATGRPGADKGVRDVRPGSEAVPARALVTEWQLVHHLVILPMVKEPYEVVRESFASLAKTNYPKDKLIVVLATEARAGEDAQETASRIQGEFGGRFGKFLVTTHPAGIPGELPGKGSNEVWAASRAKELVIDPAGIAAEHVLVSSFDVDTQVHAEYFGRLTYVFLRTPDRLRAIYQPIALFMNNIYDSPALARVVSFSATFWQMMQQARPERLTSFSSQSIPLPVLLDVGWWQKDIVSEDSRIFWQAYLHYHGEFHCEPLYFPVSMDANTAPTFWATMKNLYRQQRRWGWGAENVAYLMTGFLRDPRIPLGKKWYWGFSTIEGYHSWATNALMIFALGWLPVVMGGAVFNATLLSYNLPAITRFIINLSMVGIATSAVVSLLLLPPKPAWFRPHHYLFYFIQWFLMPVTLIVFGCFPGLEAQTRLMVGGRWRLGFWVTPKGRFKRQA